jgi:YegS/Rv2252/BmrU family lipid kinase
MSTVVAQKSTAEFAQSQSQKCVTVVFNPVSGTGDPEARQRAISDALARHGYTCQFIATSLERDAKQIAEEAVKAGVDLLAVAGGDGTVMQVMSALVGTDIPIALVPSGTGNLLSVNLGVPGTVPEAIDVALSGRPYALDLARATFALDQANAAPAGSYSRLPSSPLAPNNGGTGMQRGAGGDQRDEWRYFAIMGGIGLDAQMVEDADRKLKRRLGVMAYLWAIMKNLPRRPSLVSVSVDGGRPIRRRAKTVIVANMGKVIGGLEAMPTAVPDDGWLDVGFIMPETFGQWLRLLWMAILGRPQEAPEMDVYQGRRIAVRTPFPEPVELDGESGGRTRNVDIEVVPRAVRIMLPAEAPAAKDAAGKPAETARPHWPALAIVAATGIALGALLWRRRPR